MAEPLGREVCGIGNFFLWEGQDPSQYLICCTKNIVIKRDETKKERKGIVGEERIFFLMTILQKEKEKKKQKNKNKKKIKNQR